MGEDIAPNGNSNSRWESIIAESDIREVPINLVKSIEIYLKDGDQKCFNIEELVTAGLSHKEIEEEVQEFVETYDDDIDTLDFHINVEALANDVEQKTKRLLG